MTKKDNHKNINILNNNYISGFVHADGTFTNSIIKGTKKVYMNPRFIVKQHIDNKIILEKIREKFNNVGNIKIEKNKIVSYRITNIKNIVNIVLPFFDKYQVRGNRYFSYLKFKLLTNILANEKIVYKSELWFFCMMLSTKINPMVQLTKQLRHLTKDEQEIIKNYKIIKNLDYNYYINKYSPELNILSWNDLFGNNNIPNNSQPLTKEFICGLFDGDGSLNIRIIKNSLAVTFQIIQDSYNDKILIEILKYFNNKGTVKPHKTERSISYLNTNPSDIFNIIIPKMLGINNKNLLSMNLDYNNIDSLKIKLYKLINYIEIYKLYKDINNPILPDGAEYNKILLLLYNSKTNSKELSFKEWKEKIKKY